ncbi:hypothetical protein BU15DRAFT_78283 [Melanogaster broomeanus]|nr:hypothetical protein BU15DRAFT_78283 [Melanogaster broomeanus]
MEPQSQNHAYTILRIKRKRTEEPLDALVVESRFRRKKSRGGLDVFQFAQTVENDTWDDQQLRKSLQSQISKLAQDSNESAKGHISPVREAKPSVVPPRFPGADNGGPRYAVRVAGEDGDGKPRRRPTSPPKVISSKDVPQNDFKMYDAVLEHQRSSLPPMDPEMERFLPMLQDYLTLRDTSSSGAIPNAQVEDAIVDYVWDVFYKRPYSLSEWNSFAANVGTVTGLPPSALDDDLSDDSQSEEEDEADEDSNAEEYYKNDYPDEEDPESDNSDMFHDDSEEEDFAGDSDHDWR